MYKRPYIQIFFYTKLSCHKKIEVNWVWTKKKVMAAGYTQQNLQQIGI